LANAASVSRLNEIDINSLITAQRRLSDASVKHFRNIKQFAAACTEWQATIDAVAKTIEQELLNEAGL